MFLNNETPHQSGREVLERAGAEVPPDALSRADTRGRAREGDPGGVALAACTPWSVDGGRGISNHPDAGRRRARHADGMTTKPTGDDTFYVEAGLPVRRGEQLVPSSPTKRQPRVNP